VTAHCSAGRTTAVHPLPSWGSGSNGTESSIQIAGLMAITALDPLRILEGPLPGLCCSSRGHDPDGSHELHP
jgi:hypothetical protein